MGVNYIVEEEEWPLIESYASSRVSPTQRLQGSAGILGYIYSGNWSSTATIASELDNVEFFFDADELNSTDVPVYWSDISDSGKDSLRVYAYSPKSLGNTPVGGVSPLGVDANGVPTMSYTVPKNVLLQNDLITAVSTSVHDEYRMPISLPFEHALTAIRFKVGFDCVVKSVSINNVYNKGIYTFGEDWIIDNSSKDSYTIPGDSLVKESHTLMLMPQDLPDGATIVLVYNDGKSADKTISVDISTLEWEPGKLITYTLHTAADRKYIYFDLSAGNVKLTPSGYSGYVYVSGYAEPQLVQGSHLPTNKYYVYQSSTSDKPEFAAFNRYNTGYKTYSDFQNMVNCYIPNYDPVMYNEELWSDYITDNQSVEDVIEVWDDAKYVRGADATGENKKNIAVVRDVGRTHTNNYISVTGSNAKYNLFIDNIYSVIQDSESRGRAVGGISYVPTGGSRLSVNLVGDNRMGCLHINNKKNDTIVIEGTGSLTVADTDFKTKIGPGPNDYYGDKENYGYVSNLQNSAIGNNTLEGCENVYGLYINSGVVFAGTTKTENCTAIGGGGNGSGQVFITGGKVTAVATTAGTAIGGGMGHDSHGGPGEVHISGGNVYAYNFANRWGISSAAIGGGGSVRAQGSNGTVRIEGGYIYAYSALGTAIGGGSSLLINGGNSNVNISGGYIIAKSKKANGIGGGMGGTKSGSNGGTAKIVISGNPTIRTGSVGGGKTNNSEGTIGYADIDISGGDIQAQFVMSKGSSIAPTFDMTGGWIRNSYTNDDEYFHIEENGGAVYMEYGKCTINGGVIDNCYGVNGGAIYINGDTTSTRFVMYKGAISDCIAVNDGGAICLEGGEVEISGGTITDNLANGGNGGGISIRDGNFDMSDTAVITRNSSLYNTLTGSGGNGGGVYITSTDSKVRVNIKAGSITENSSDRTGGGVCVDMAGNDNSATVTVGGVVSMTDTINPTITHNNTILSGGGLYVSGANANVVINSGNIYYNATSAYVDNEDVANELGMVKLSGGKVQHAVVTFHGNGGFYTKDDVDYYSAIQNIVTATNSTLVPPETFIQLGYKFTGWNTKADGNGDPYTNGQIMNITNNLELYAQWEIL